MNAEDGIGDPLRTSGTGQTPPNHPTEQPGTDQTSAREVPQEAERQSEPRRGSAAPEHDVGAAPGMAAAGPHGWPLSMGGAPMVTGGENIHERDLPSSGQDEGEAPELGMGGEP